MKRILFIILTCILLFCIGCAKESKGQNPSHTPSASAIKNKPTAKSEKVMNGKIIKIENDMILVADTEQIGLYQISSDAFLGDISLLSSGDMVEIGFDGLVLETYPAILANIQYIMFLEKSQHIVGLYYDIFMKLYNADLALNADINLIALDLTKDKNLTDSEKNALLYLLWNTTHLQSREATYEDLLSENLITLDAHTGYSEFKTGVLLKLETSEAEKESFSFNAEKWRSSLGAYFFTDCQAKKENGKWIFEIGSEMIS